MDDLRIAWMKERLYAGLDLRDDNLFKELFAREDGWAGRELNAFLDSECEQLCDSIIFYAVETNLERDVEVEEGKYTVAAVGARDYVVACCR